MSRITTRRPRRTLPAAALAAPLLLAVAAPAGPVWQEGDKGTGDAQSAPATAQETCGKGQLGSVKGATSSGAAVAGASDLEDMYVVRICDPRAFRASTVPANGGDADFDTQLWLFRPGPTPGSGLGVLANDDTAAPPSAGSRLLADPTDGSPSLAMPGIYFLAISGSGNVPLAADGPIFLLASPTEISGPDGPGGPGPIIGWSASDGPAKTGSYTIALQGVTFAQGLGTIDCNRNGVHDACDLAFGDATDLNDNGVIDECDVPGDLDGDGDVDVGDLLVLLGQWGPCPPGPCGADIDMSGDVDVGDLLALLGNWT